MILSAFGAFGSTGGSGRYFGHSHRRHCAGAVESMLDHRNRIAQLLKLAGLTASSSEALRLIAQRGLKVDGDVVADKALVLGAGKTFVVQAGKRKFARVTLV